MVETIFQCSKYLPVIRPISRSSSERFVFAQDKFPPERVSVDRIPLRSSVVSKSFLWFDRFSCCQNDVPMARAIFLRSKDFSLVRTIFLQLWFTALFCNLGLWPVCLTAFPQLCLSQLTLTAVSQRCLPQLSLTRVVNENSFSRKWISRNLNEISRNFVNEAKISRNFAKFRVI